jgi:hypothetical protein
MDDAIHLLFITLLKGYFYEKYLFKDENLGEEIFETDRVVYRVKGISKIVLKFLLL